MDEYHRKLHEILDKQMEFFYKANYIAIVLSLIAVFLSCGALISVANHLR